MSETVHTIVDDFVPHPEGIKFETQADDEKIVLFMRKHVITNLSWLLITIILLLLPPLLFSGVIGFSFVELLSLSPQTVVAIILAWYLFVFGYAFEHFIVWYFNFYLVTNRRVVDVDFFHLLYKAISAA